MNYIPIVRHYLIDFEPLCLHLTKTVPELSSEKMISEFEHHIGIGICFVDEDGSEYRALVGPRSSPISTVVVEIFEENAGLIPSEEQHAKAKSKMDLFISWLKEQRLCKEKE